MSLQKGSKADQYVVHNLTRSGVYLRNNLSNTLLQKVLTLVPLEVIIPDVFVATMTTFLSDCYDASKETLTYMKSLKLYIYPGENSTDFCATILVDSKRLHSSWAFNNEHLGYITGIFEESFDSRFCPW